MAMIVGNCFRIVEGNIMHFSILLWYSYTRGVGSL